MTLQSLRPTLLLALLLIPGPAVASAPALLATGSFLVPGLGQFINGEPAKGGFHLATWGTAADIAAYYRTRDDYIEPGDRHDEDELVITTNRTSERADLFGTVASSTRFYSAFDAYRQRRTMRGNRGYRTPISDEGFQDLARAPFEARYLSRPTTFVPMAIAASGLLLSSEDSWVTRTQGGLTRHETAAMLMPRQGAVALGEEAFFRGVLNNSFHHQFGPWWGTAASSVGFGLAHSGAGLSANAGVATAYGVYLGWLHRHNDYRLGENVAVHFWWNVLVSAAALRHDPDERTAVVRWEFRF
ncbi:MAG: CPBP family intramembrane glutamic endopeptidase [Thiohalospira sp.]